MNENFTASDFAAFCAAHHPAYQRNYYAMYSSWWDGITTDPNLMVIPIDEGEPGHQKMRRITKNPDGTLQEEVFGDFTFVPMLSGTASD